MIFVSISGLPKAQCKAKAQAIIQLNLNYTSLSINFVANMIPTSMYDFCQHALS